MLGLTVVQTGRQFSLNGKPADMLKTNLGVHLEGIGIEMQKDGGVGALEYGEPPSFDQESPR